MSLPKSLVTEMDTYRAVDYQNQSIRKWDAEHSIDFNILLKNGSWQYRGEGNANIVLAVEGVQVLRLQKVKTSDHPPTRDWIRERKNLEREVIFANEVFGPLIGTEFVGIVQIVTLSLSQIDDLNRCLKNLRPANRLHKELGVPYATCHKDLTRIHSSLSEHVNYCVEIKPKQGSWTRTILGESTILCTFCLNQFLKLKMGKVTGRSHYCPLNLFSGDPVRLVGAVLALIKTPQNNFRIFRNGELVYGDNCGNESLEAILREWFGNCGNIGAFSTVSTDSERNLVNFLYLICTSLLKPQNPERSSSSAQVFKSLKGKLRKILLEPYQTISSVAEKEKEACNVDVRELPEGSILFRILQAQNLGKLVSGSIYKLYPKICPVHSSFQSTESSSCPSTECLVDDKWLDERSSSTRLTHLELLSVEHYLIATTAKDCSIMTTFSPLTKTNGECMPGKDSIQDLNGKSHRIKTGVADLDPKPVTSIARHHTRDLVMLEAYQRYLSQNSGSGG